MLSCQTFEPKEADRIAPGLAPSGPFFLVNRSSNPNALGFRKRIGSHHRGAHPAPGGTRKLSVPVRVHSIQKSYGSRKASLLLESNPFLTRGTVESPAKYLPVASLLKSRKAAASNQSTELHCPTPFL